MNNQQNSNVVSDDFLAWLDKVIKFSKESIFMGGECDDMQIRLMEQIRDKYVSLNSGLNTINEPIKDEEVNDELSAEKVIKNCLEAARWNMEHANVAPEYQQDFYNINANAICDCEEFLESKLNNSVEDKPELTELLCNGRKVEVNDKDYVVTSATRATNNSIIFHLSGEKDSLQLKLKQ